MALAAESPNDSRNDHRSSPAVTIAGVGHSFGEGAQKKPVLSAIDLTLRRGEFVVLTGPSGAGKTTLLTLVGTLRTLKQGSIDVMGTELAGLAPALQRRLRRRIGFIFQDHNLFDALTVFQTLRLATELAEIRPSRSEVLEKASALLAQIGMENYMHSRPGQLSTGQKQRVAIARALINDPELILADEPTASLDQAASQSVIDLLKRRVKSQNAAVLMVTHDHRIFGVADRVVHMVDGRIAATR
jgi:putative ABC transport system ATP-binding protein